MIIAKSISMDIVQKGVTPVVDVVQGDKYSRAIGISIYKAGSAWYIPEKANVTIGYIKPDGTRGLYDTLPDGTSAYSLMGNVVTAKLAPQMLTVPGTVKSTVIISIEDCKIGTFPIEINVAPNSAAGAVGSEDYYCGSGIVDNELSEESENPVQNKVVTNALRNKADLDDVYVEVSETAAVYDEGIAVASVEEFSFTSSNAVKNYVAKTASCSPGSDVPIYVTSVKVAIRSGADYAQVCKFSIWEYTKRYPDSAGNKEYIFTKVRDCGSTVPSDNLAEITFPNGERIEPNQVMLASTAEAHANVALGYLAYGSKDYKNSAIVYANQVSTIDSKVGDNFISAIPGEWTAVYTTTYTLEAPENTGGDEGEGGDTGEGGGNGNKRKIKEVIPEMLADIAALKASDGNAGSTVSNSRSTRKSVNKYFVLTVDDVEASFLTIADRLIEIGFYPALALKMESINNGGITWDDVRTLQNMGFEIAFHGMLHSHTPAGTAPGNDAVMLADIAEYKALCKDNGIDIVGYCGPNHYPLPVDAFKEFEWARSPYNLTTYGAGNRFADSFASVIVWSCELTGSSNMEELKTTMIAEADKLADNQYLTPMCHSQNLVAYIDDYMEVFNAWINKGLTPMRCRDAVKQSLWECGGIGQNSTFEIQAGTATAPYCVIAGNGIMRSNQGTE